MNTIYKILPKPTNEILKEWYINNTENIIAIKYDGDKISADEVKIF